MTQPRLAPDRTQDEAIVRAVDLAAGYGGRAVIQGISCALRGGELVGVVGPNGCGKSTLLKTLGGNLGAMSGRVLLDHQPLAALPRRRRARLLAMLPQHPDAPPGMSVRQLVHCGRTPHTPWFAPPGAADRTLVEQAMRSCDLDALADRALAELSGGERQRAWIAMTIAQQTRVLLLDEPTSALDLRHQLDVMHLLEDLTRQRQLAVALVMHDVNLAIRFCDRVMVMQHGRLVGQWRRRDGVDTALLERVFAVRPACAADGATHAPSPLCFIRCPTASHCLNPQTCHPSTQRSAP